MARSMMAEGYFVKRKVFILVAVCVFSGVLRGRAKTEIIWWHAMTGFLG